MSRSSQSSRSGSKDPMRARPPKPVLPDFENMLPMDVVAYVQPLLDQLKKKQARELAYITRRFDSEANTPTDEAYRDDQVLEDRLIHFLAYFIKAFER